jgi:copper(I)-binding protein
MRALPATALGLLLLAGCNRTPAPPQVIAKDVIVTLPAVAGRPGAAYFELRTNHSPTTLVSVTSPLIQRIELHQTKGGSMRKITSPEDLSFPGNRTLEFEPGGKHAMLFGIDKAVKVGGTVPITFTVDPAPAVTVEAKVHAPGDVSGSHEAH